MQTGEQLQVTHPTSTHLTPSQPISPHLTSPQLTHPTPSSVANPDHLADEHSSRPNVMNPGKSPWTKLSADKKHRQTDHSHLAPRTLPSRRPLELPQYADIVPDAAPRAGRWGSPASCHLCLVIYHLSLYTCRAAVRRRPSHPTKLEKYLVHRPQVWCMVVHQWWMVHGEWCFVHGVSWIVHGDPHHPPGAEARGDAWLHQVLLPARPPGQDLPLLSGPPHHPSRGPRLPGAPHTSYLTPDTS